MRFARACLKHHLQYAGSGVVNTFGHLEWHPKIKITGYREIFENRNGKDGDDER